MDYADNVSSRADVSRFHWRNVYHYGDFHGSSERMLQYYDVHYYIANWGVQFFALAFPGEALDITVVDAYSSAEDTCESGLKVICKKGRCQLWWQFSEEEVCWGWIEGDEHLDQLTPIRQQILQGDYRALFLGWLINFDCDEAEDERETIPPIPPGLNKLDSALEQLIDLFQIDRDAIQAAAALSGDLPTDNLLPLDEIIKKLSEAKMHAMLKRVAEGDAIKVQTELNRLRIPKSSAPATPAPLTFAEFRTAVQEAGIWRQQAKENAAAAKRKREKAARRKQLKALFVNGDASWVSITKQMETKTASSYDRVASLIKDLKEAYAQESQSRKFSKHLKPFRETYGRSAAMMRRIEKL